VAVDLWPYSGRNDGAVNDLEHEYLWSGAADGVLPGQAANACQVGLSGSNWTVNPGRFRIAGHVLNLDVTQSGTLPSSSSAVRRSLVVAYIDHSQAPWTYGVQLVTGSPGGGRPAITTSRTGLYQVPLRAMDTATNGTTTLLADERVILDAEGGGILRATNTVPTQVPLLVIGAQDQTGDLVSIRGVFGTRYFDISEVGRVGINTNGAPGATGVHIKGAAPGDTTVRISAVSGQTGFLMEAVNAGGTTVASIDANGNLAASNFAATNWTNYTPEIDHIGSATFSSRTGRWKRIAAKTVAFSIFWKVGLSGSGASSPVTFRLPTVPSRTINQTFHGHARTNSGVQVLMCVCRTTGISNWLDEIIQADGGATGIVRGLDLSAGMEASISGIYEED
jgi:hypothetical protein